MIIYHGTNQEQKKRKQQKEKQQQKRKQQQRKVKKIIKYIAPTRPKRIYEISKSMVNTNNNFKLLLPKETAGCLNINRPHGNVIAKNWKIIFLKNSHTIKRKFKKEAIFYG